MNTRGHNTRQAHVAALRPARLHPPDPGPKVKRASPSPTARLQTSTRPPAPRNRPWADLHPAPTLDPCPGHALAPDPGLDASLEATDCFLQSPLNLSEDVSVQLSTMITGMLCSLLHLFIMTLWGILFWRCGRFCSKAIHESTVYP